MTFIPIFTLPWSTTPYLHGIPSNTVVGNPCRILQTTSHKGKEFFKYHNLVIKNHTLGLDFEKNLSYNAYRIPF